MPIHQTQNPKHKSQDAHAADEHHSQTKTVDMMIDIPLMRGIPLHEPIENTDPHGEIVRSPPFHKMEQSRPRLRHAMSEGSIFDFPIVQTPNGEAHGAYSVLTNSLHARSKHISPTSRPNTATSPVSHLPMPSPPILSLSTLAKQRHLDESINALKDSTALIATNVSVNADNTATNTRDIGANKEAITSHTEGIDTNVWAIAAAVDNIASNDNRITANGDEIAANHDEVTALRTAMTECGSRHEAYVTQTDDRMEALEDRLFGMSPVTEVQKPGIFGELRWFRKHRDECVVVLLVSNVLLFACLVRRFRL